MERYSAKRDQDTLTRVTVEQYEKRYIIESPYSDENALETLIRCVAAAAVACSWSKEQVLDAMQDYIDENRPETNE